MLNKYISRYIEEYIFDFMKFQIYSSTNKKGESSGRVIWQSAIIRSDTHHLKTTKYSISNLVNLIFLIRNFGSFFLPKLIPIFSTTKMAKEIYSIRSSLLKSHIDNAIVEKLQWAYLNGFHLTNSNFIRGAGKSLSLSSVETSIPKKM